jgi:hypothetical protein
LVSQAAQLQVLQQNLAWQEITHVQLLVLLFIECALLLIVDHQPPVKLLINVQLEISLAKIA